MNIYLAKLINSTGYWLRGNLFVHRVLSCSNLNYEGRAYYVITHPAETQLSTFSNFHKISLKSSPPISRTRCILCTFENVRNCIQIFFLLVKLLESQSIAGICMAYGNMIAFVLSMLTFIVVSANLENFHVDKHKVEKWNNKQ